MRLRTQAIFAIGCVTLAALSIPALSRPSPRGIEPEARTQAGGQQQIQQLRPTRRAVLRKHRIVRKPAVGGPVDERYPHLERTPAAKLASKPLFGWPSLVTEARKYIGTNPTSLSRRWCARFMNFVLDKAGYSGTGSDAAKSFAHYGERISKPQVGAIAVLNRGKNQNLGHVGVITGLDKRGNPIIISGNHGRRVAESVYPRARVIAYVMPTNGGRAVRAAPRSVQPAQRVAQPHAQRMAQPQQRSLSPQRVVQPRPVQPQPRPLVAPGQRLAQASDKPSFVVAVEATMQKMFGDSARTR